MRWRGPLFLLAAAVAALAVLRWADVVPLPGFLGGRAEVPSAGEDAPDAVGWDGPETGPMGLASRPRPAEAGEAPADGATAGDAAGAASRAPVGLDGVVLRSDGRPAAGARIAARGSDGVPVTGFADAEGRFHLDLAPGLYDLVVRGGLDGALFLPSVLVDGRPLAPLELSGAADVRIEVASSGQGVPGASVRARLTPDGGGALVVAEGVTAGDGSFRAEGIPLGRYAFEVDTAEGVTLTRRADVTADLTLAIPVPPPARLHGRVTDALSRAPVPARVVVTLVLGEGLTAEVAGAAGADGVYALAVPRGRVQQFAVESADHAPFPSAAEAGAVLRSLQALRTQEVVVRDAALQPGAVVRGLVVTTGAKEPVPGLTLRFVQDRNPVARAVETGEDGAYEVRGLGQGTWRATIESAGWYPGPGADTVRLGAPGPDGRPAEGTLDLEVWSAGRISGVVLTPGDTPAGGARVWLVGGGGVVRGARQAGRALETVAGSDGAFALDDVPPNVVLRVRAALGGAEAVPAGPYRLMDGPVPPVRLVLAPTARLHGRVTDELTRDAVAGATVTVDAVGEPAGRGRRSVVTDAQGRYEVVALLAGGWRVTPAKRRDYLPSEGRALEVAGDLREIPLDLTLDPGLPIGGVVLDPAGRAVVGARVTLGGTEDAATPSASVGRNATTDAAGTWRWTGLRSGRYALTVRKSGFQAARLDLRGGEDRLRVLLAPPPPAAGN